MTRDHPGVIAQGGGGTCDTCHQPIVAGQRITIHRERWHHVACWQEGRE